MASIKSTALFWTSLPLLVILFIVLLPGSVESENPSALMQEFIGSETCANCHADPELSESGFNIWEESQNEAHWHALTLPGTQFPEGTNDAEVMPPPGTSLDEFAYVMGGFGWKTTFVRKDGSQVTGESNAQYILETGEWTSYHPGEDLPFDAECARCHTTGITPNGSWNGNPADSLGTFAEIGVRCEGCHGPSSLHATRALTTSEGETRVLLERCGDCHNNGGKGSPVPAEDGFVVNHAQYQELKASRHGSISFFTCITCHEPHVPMKYKDLAGKTFNGKQLDPIRKPCQECHPTSEPNHPTPIECIDCHMPSASKSAVGIEYANGGARGDIASHIWRINTAAVSRDEMFTPDGAYVKPDESGWLSVTLDFACLGCHNDPDETLSWASEQAQTIHTTTTSTDPVSELPATARIVSNYPNPFTQSTTLSFEILEPGPIQLSIYNSSGQRVAVLSDGERAPGAHHITWDGLSDSGQPLSSGVYFARLQSEQVVTSHKLLLVR